VQQLVLVALLAKEFLITRPEGEPAPRSAGELSDPPR
jgi:hypothetical protein